MRKTATFITCDGDGCRTMAEVVAQSDTPDGWHRVAEAKDGKLQLNEAFDFCSLRCIEKWAKARRHFLAGSGNGNGHGQHAPVRAAVLEALGMSDEPLTSVYIAEMTGFASSGVRINIGRLIDEGLVECVREPQRGNSAEPALYKLAK